MKLITPIIIAIAAILASCETQPVRQNAPKMPLPIIGTWELISATSTEKDSTFSTFEPKNKMIKMITPTHFAFFNHAISTDKNADAAFTAGGGTYQLTDSLYTEHLEYFNQKEWEGHSFQFVVTIKNDTLTQQGIEKIEALGIERIIVERYTRVK